MYIKITSICNMSCAHCCNSCTSEGQHMDLETWKKSLDLALAHWDNVTLGGGEPTLHPNFWQMLGESIAKAEYVWLATNGSQTEIALALAKMAKKGIIGCALSQDDYHDEIDEEVIEAFTKSPKNRNYGESDPDCREIRDVTNKVVNAGRCNFGKEGCVCSEIIIEPNGIIRACGCDDAPYFGTVDEPEIPNTWLHGECWKNQEEE